VTDVLLDARAIRVAFRTRPFLGARTRSSIALDGVDFSVGVGESVGLVGESGSGKSTLARVLLGLQRADAGLVRWRGTPVDLGDRRAMLAMRREMQPVFQDPVGSLDPRMTVRESIAEALEALEGLHDPAVVDQRVQAALDDVALDRDLVRRYPHQLSGGQCQRVAIARAMITRPRLLLCDEAVSALDVSVQAQIVNLLKDLHQRTGVAILFISHNIAVVRQLCDRIVVLKSGRVVEDAPTDSLLTAPVEPYTRALIASVPLWRPVR
jgi:ABC-type microcin C transport system duplicated ATPase subunit YejF